MPISPPITSEDVHAIGNFACDDLTPFIDIAEAYVVPLLEGKVTDKLLRLITLYLSAHFAQLKEGGDIISETIGPSTTSYSKAIRTGFLSTEFGRTAASMDPTGAIKNAEDVKGYIEVIDV